MAAGNAHNDNFPERLVVPFPDGNKRQCWTCGAKMDKRSSAIAAKLVLEYGEITPVVDVLLTSIIFIYFFHVTHFGVSQFSLSRLTFFSFVKYAAFAKDSISLK